MATKLISYEIHLPSFATRGFGGQVVKTSADKSAIKSKIANHQSEMPLYC